MESLRWEKFSVVTCQLSLITTKRRREHLKKEQNYGRANSGVEVREGRESELRLTTTVPLFEHSQRRSLKVPPPLLTASALPTTTSFFFALEKATFSLLGSETKERLDVAVTENTTTFFSLPWKASTVPTSTKSPKRDFTNLTGPCRGR